MYLIGSEYEQQIQELKAIIDQKDVKLNKKYTIIAINTVNAAA